MQQRNWLVVCVIAVLAFATLNGRAAGLGLINGDFELGVGQLQDVPSWYESSTSGFGDFVVPAGDSRFDPPFTLTRVGGLGAGGYIYQQIGTYEPNLSFSLTGAVYRADVHYNTVIPGLTVSLFSGNISPADGSTPGTLGATLLDSVAQTSGDLGFVIPGSVNVSTGFAFSVSLNTGNSGTIGQPLWLMLEGVGGSNQLYFDNLSVPEPSVALLLGVGGLLFWRRK